MAASFHWPSCSTSTLENISTFPSGNEAPGNALADYHARRDHMETAAVSSRVIPAGRCPINLVTKASMAALPRVTPPHSFWSVESSVSSVAMPWESRRLKASLYAP